MNAREGAPAGKQKAPTVQTRTTSHATPFARRAPRFGFWDVVAWALFILIIVGMILLFCALTWAVA